MNSTDFAYHYAAHAVARVATRTRFTFVTIDRVRKDHVLASPRYSGCPATAGPGIVVAPPMTISTAFDVLCRETCCMMVSSLADDMRGVETAPEVMQDLQTEARFRIGVVCGARYTAPDWLTYVDDTEATRIWDALTSDAEHLVAAYWPAIANTAVALRQKGILGSTAVRSSIRTTFGKIPHHPITAPYHLRDSSVRDRMARRPPAGGRA